MGYNLTQINPAYELVSDIVVGTATTTVDFTGLSFDKTDDLMLVSTIRNTTASVSYYYLFANNNTTNTNYYSEELWSAGTSYGASRPNISFFGVLTASTELSIRSYLKLTNTGYFSYMSKITKNFNSAIEQGNIISTSTFTATSLTQLTLTASVTNAIGAGSRFQLYKRKAPVVFDYTVSGSAVTLVDITGLSIDKGSEYQLVMTTVNSGATKMYVNGNTTDTNYYRQSLLSASASVASGRDNNPYINNYGGTNLLVVKLKLTNNGYYVWQTDSSTNIGGSSILIDNVYGTSTFTMSSITSLSLVNSTFAVGSRFQLIKLK